MYWRIQRLRFNVGIYVSVLPVRDRLCGGLPPRSGHILPLPVTVDG